MVIRDKINSSTPNSNFTSPNNLRSNSNSKPNSISTTNSNLRSN